MIRIQGGKQFAVLAKKLRTVNDPKLKKEFYSGINRAARPLPAAVRKSARNRLPKSGGLAERIARSDIKVNRRVTGNAAGVRIVGSHEYDIGSINRGRVRHRTFGHEPWVNQAVERGFWDDPLKAGSPAVKAALQKVMDDVSRQLQ